MNYSTFCTCSRICSISTFMSTVMRVVSRSCDFEASVLASRLSSCMRKSSRRPAPSLRAHDAARFFDVAGEAIEFFGDIEALQLQHDFLLDAIAVDRGQQLGDAFVQARAHAGLDFRQARAHLGDQRVRGPRSVAR